MVSYTLQLFRTMLIELLTVAIIAPSVFGDTHELRSITIYPAEKIIILSSSWLVSFTLVRAMVLVFKYWLPGFQSLPRSTPYRP